MTLIKLNSRIVGEYRRLLGVDNSIVRNVLEGFLVAEINDYKTEASR